MPPQKTAGQHEQWNRPTHGPISWLDNNTEILPNMKENCLQ